MIELIRRLSPIAFTFLVPDRCGPSTSKDSCIRSSAVLVFLEIMDYRNRRTLSFDPEDPRIAESMGNWVRKGSGSAIRRRVVSDRRG